jgi:glycosyltransferase involved in cell wall biosynthesis
VFLSKEDLFNAYRDSRVCLNVFSNNITIGLPEILMSGIPLVTVPFGQAASYLTDGVNAIVSRDINYLRSQLSTLYRDNEYAVRLGKAGRAVALEHFNLMNKLPLWREAFEG